MCRAVSFNVENSFVSTSHWPLTQTALFAIARMQPCFQVAVKIATVVAVRPGAVLGPAVSRLRRRGQAWLGQLGLSASRGCCVAGGSGWWPPVRSRRVAVQMWGRLSDLWLLECGPWSALPCWHMLRRGAVAPDRRTPLEGPLHNKLALLLALVSWKYIRKNFTTSRDGRI